jgi:hypothetical protein
MGLIVVLRNRHSIDWRFSIAGSTSFPAAAVVPEAPYPNLGVRFSTYFSQSREWE